MLIGADWTSRTSHLVYAYGRWGDNCGEMFDLRQSIARAIPELPTEAALPKGFPKTMLVRTMLGRCPQQELFDALRKALAQGPETK